jgi:lysozyme
MTRAVPRAAYDIVREFEQCRLVCFDTDGTGTPTIGWGRTRGLTHADVGRKRISQETADAYLDVDLEEAARTLEDQIGAVAVAAMTSNQYSAILSLVYNEGPLGPTIVRLLRARQFDSVPPQIARYVYGHVPGRKEAVKINGLVRRRAAEQVLWAVDEPGSHDVHVSSGTLREVATPPAPSSENKPLHRQGSFVATCATAVTTVSVAAAPVVETSIKGLTTMSEKIAPYADANEHVGQVRGVIVGVLAGLAVLSVVLLWLKDRARKLESAGAPQTVARPVVEPVEDPVEPVELAPVPAAPAPAVQEPVQLELPMGGALHISVVDRR